MSFLRKISLPALLCLLALLAIRPAAAANPAPAEQVFSLTAERDATGMVRLRFGAAPGNYLYRDSLSAKRDGKPLTLETPAGEKKDDPNFGRVEIYHGSVVATLAVAPATGTIEIGYQGCAEQGVTDGMQQHVSIGVSVQPLFVGNLDPADDAAAAFHQLVYVESLSYPDHVALLDT